MPDFRTLSFRSGTRNPRAVAALLLGTILVGCTAPGGAGVSKYEPTYMRLTEERAFAESLRQRYLELATHAYDRGDLDRSDFYSLRALMAVEGKLAAPTRPDTVTLDAGTYWPHTDSAPAAYPGLYTHILTKMNAVAVGYAFEMTYILPTGAGSTWPWGIRISTSPAQAWTWNPAGTINATQALGWRTTDGATVATSGRVDSPRMARYQWHPTEPPSQYRSTPHRVVTMSTEYVERQDAYAFDQGERRKREVVVEYQVAAHVYKNAADFNGWYQTAGVTPSDDNNALEWCWDALNRGAPLIWVWYEDGEALDLLTSNGEGYAEVAVMSEPDQRQDFGALLRTIRVAGEMYTITINTVRVDDDDNTWSL